MADEPGVRTRRETLRRWSCLDQEENIARTDSFVEDNHHGEWAGQRGFILIGRGFFLAGQCDGGDMTDGIAELVQHSGAAGARRPIRADVQSQWGKSGRGRGADRAASRELIKTINNAVAEIATVIQRIAI